MPRLSADDRAEVQAKLDKLAGDNWQDRGELPYRVFYVRREGVIVVFRVLHSARRDREWKSNVPKE